MLVTDVQTAARDLYNAVGDSFFGDTQINNWMTEACNVLAMKAMVIEAIYSTTTVAGTQDYGYPTNTIAIKRVTINGKKIKRVTHREDDALTLSNAASTQTGFPTYYTDFNYTLSLRTIPDAAYTLKIYSFNLPTAIGNTSTLEVPALFHFCLVDYILMRMFAKDKDVANVQLHRSFWEEHVKDAVSWQRRKKRMDSFATVQDEETLPVTILGEV